MAQTMGGSLAMAPSAYRWKRCPAGFNGTLVSVGWRGAGNSRYPYSPLIATGR
jgi:hypothetical protein